MSHEREDNLTRINHVLGKARVAILTSRDSSGALHARPLALKVDDVNDGVRFLVRDGSESVDSVATDPRVNVSVQHGNDYVSLAGEATVSAEPAVIDELWSPFAEAWFPQGRKDQSIRVLTVHVHTAEYWVTDHNVVKAVFSTVKAATGRGTPDIGENEAVQL